MYLISSLFLPPVINNYCHDSIENLSRENAKDITAIRWNVYGKILRITKDADPLHIINYTYDASGNRITKNVAGKTTIYVRDGSGNVMSVYEKTGSGNLEQAEVHLYGSSRLGILGKLTVPSGYNISLTGGGTATKSTYTRGDKLFELSNHLGNVLATVSDRRMQVNNSGWWNIIRRMW